MTFDATALYYDLVRPFRPAVSYARWKLFRRSLEVCQRCDAPAQWRYAPAGPNLWFCDHCVARGCDCNFVYLPNRDRGPLACTGVADDERIEQLDDRGRSLPCCEFDFLRYG
jgi:hypothetical protein